METPPELPHRNEHGFTAEEWDAMDEQMREGIEMAAVWETEYHPELFVEVEKTAYTPEVALEIEKQCSDFEERFPLDQLLSLETAEQALASELRTLAVREYQFLKDAINKIDIPTEQQAEVASRLKKIVLAVGFVTADGKCRHEE